MYSFIQDEYGDRIKHVSGRAKDQLGIAEIGQEAFHPSGELDFDVECGAVASEVIRIAQPGKEFVLDIPGGPQAIQVM